MTDKKHCAYCHAILFDEDDVVYCPECGAPHHRECYNQLGECAKKAMHGLEPENTPEPEQKDSRPEGIPLDREGHICKRCGKISSSDTLFCPYCATPFVEAGRIQFGQGPNIYGPGANDPYGGVDPKEQLEGVSVHEYASFVRSNTQRYIPIFKRLADGKKAGWNWGAFFFGHSWLFFRKCYREGFIALLFRLIVVLLNTPINVSLYTFMFENNVSYQDVYASPELATQILSAIPPIAWIMMLLAMLASIAISVVLAVFGDRIYMTRVKKRINQIKEEPAFEDKSTAIAMSGGCNFFSAVTLYYLFNILSNLIMSLFM